MITIPGFTIIEKVFENQNTVIYRAIADNTNHTVIIKTHRNSLPTNRQILAYRKEFEITSKLNVSGILRSYELKKIGNQYLIVFEDTKAISLKVFSSYNHITLSNLLEIFISIVNVINQIHKHNIIHKDINPSNILIHPKTQEIRIIDFGISSLYSKENIENTKVEILEGSLPYISPEQTGRMNRPLDYRSDFYSLGITFFELLAKKTPFQSEDSMDLIHSHIAKSPPNLFSEAIIYYPDKEQVIRKLSELILKLLAKDPENRYQSASGVAYDLEKILDHLKADSKTLLLLEIGKNDFSGKLQIPSKLYGREKEKKILLDTFHRAAKNFSELIFIHGYTGTGKTTLVNELRKDVLKANGYFISGKYEELNRNIPYTGFLMAARDFIRQILLGKAEEIEIWKDKILNNLGQNAKLIINEIPEVEIITGKMEDIEELDDQESNNRFHLALKNFIQLFQDPSHPILIFLDNLQWADSSSLKLLEYFTLQMQTKHILLVCSYQNTEANLYYTVKIFIQEVKEKYSQVQDIKINNLKIEDINNLVSDTINYPQEKCLELSDLIYQKTSGNPFFVNEFLKLIYLEQYLQPVEKPGKGFEWRWNKEQIRNLNISDNLADIVTSNLKLLHPNTEVLIQIASCLGNSFTSEILSLLTGENKFEIEESLISAVTSGLIIVSGDTYRFLHEKLQFAAYSLLNEKKKYQLHAKIASSLLNKPIDFDIRDDIFTITNHLNLGKDFLPNDLPKLKASELNMEAGKKAKSSAAYEVALNYFINGIHFIEAYSEENNFNKHKYLKVNFYLEAAECGYLLNKQDVMEEYLSKTLNETDDLIIKARVSEIKNKYLITSGNPSLAIQNTIELLRELGINFPTNPNIVHVLISLIKVQNILRKKTFQELSSYKTATDTKFIVAMKLISIIGSAAYFASPNLLPLLILENVYLSLKCGYSPFTPFSFSAYGIILCGTLGKVDKGYDFAKLALNIYEEVGGIKSKTKILHMVNSFIIHWKDHIRLTIDPLWECYQSGTKTGDLEFSFYGMIQYAFHSFFAGKELFPLEKEVALAAKSFENYNHINSRYQIKIFHLVLLGLIENKENPLLILEKGKKHLNEKDIDKTSVEANSFYYNFYNLFLHYYFGGYLEGLKYAELALLSSSSMLSLAIYPVLLFLHSLCLLENWSHVNFFIRKKYLKKVKANQRKMKKWAKHSPMNFLHKFYLVEAEINRVSNNQLAAIDYYELAIQFAKQYEFTQEVALTNELAGKFFRSLNKNNIAKSYLNSAVYYYHIWGALAKVKQLEETYPAIVDNIYKEDSVNKNLKTASIITQRSDTESFNLASMVKVSEAISKEIQLEKLLSSLVKILIENAGAERGVLILEKDNKLFIEAEASFNKNETSVLQSIPLDEANLPLTVINYAIRFSEYIVLNDAIKSERFSKDPYVFKNKSKSILCFPIFHKQNLFGIFYLENNLSSYAFKKNSVELLVMISSQSAISIENARLYASLESRVNERTKELDDSLKQQFKLNENLRKITDELNQSLMNIKRDLVLAKKIQDSILPKNLSDITHLNISTFYSPMDEVGGDFFDITQLHEGQIRIFLSDATGHGIQGALITMAIKSEYESLKMNIPDPKDLLEFLNNEFLRKFHSINAFFSCILLDIYTNEGKIIYSAAGHPPQILIHDKMIQKLTSTGKIIGINEDVHYKQNKFPFKKNDKLFLYSDGIFEEFNYVRDEFGEERLWELLQNYNTNPVSETLNIVVQQVDDFLGNLPQEDDMTFLGIEYRE